LRLLHPPTILIVSKAWTPHLSHSKFMVVHFGKM
jgi:hypothetical protein